MGKDRPRYHRHGEDAISQDDGGRGRGGGGKKKKALAGSQKKEEKDLQLRSIDHHRTAKDS